MGLVIEGEVGPIKAGERTENPIRTCTTGEQAVSDVHPRYYESTIRRATYNGAIVGQVTSAGLSTTYTGLCLSNPIGSGKNLVITKAGYSFIVAFAAGAHIGLMTGYSANTNVTHTTPVTPRSQFFNTAGGGVGLLDSAATLPVAPTVNTILGSGLTGAITTVPNIGPFLADIEGSIILPPGAYCAFYTSTASGAGGGAFSFTWEEVDI